MKRYVLELPVVKVTHKNSLVMARKCGPPRSQRHVAEVLRGVYSQGRYRFQLDGPQPRAMTL